MKSEKWYVNSYRRSLLDMHIDEWDESMMYRFDPVKYVELLVKGGVKSTYFFTNSHVGHCYYSTKTGHMHSRLGGRDILGEVIELCHKNDIDVILYYSLIFNNRAFSENPSWGVRDVHGEIPHKDRRYRLCCPNTGYRNFVTAQLEEICLNYDFEGIFLDMAFWREVCYCDSCRKRFRDETSHEMPDIINWQDERWLEFQRKREEWMGEFTSLAAGTVRKLKPEVSLTYQNSPVTRARLNGVTEDLSSLCDYVLGDLYGGFLEQSFICKLYRSLTPNMPFEYQTSSCFPNNGEHVTRRTPELFQISNYYTLAHNGAFCYIDCVDTTGDVYPVVYENMNRVYGESKKYEPHLGGELCMDAGIYFNCKSKIDFKENGKNAIDVNVFTRTPHLNAALGATEVLKQEHIPFGVITNRRLDDMFSCQVVILPDVHSLDIEEQQALTEFVKNGGSLYASGHTAMTGLQDLLGVTCSGITEGISYIRLTDNSFTRDIEGFMPEIGGNRLLTINNPQVMARAVPDAKIKGIINLPFKDTKAPAKLVSFHSNPPWEDTDYAAIVCRRFGKGRVVWVSAPIEAEAGFPHKKVFASIIRSLQQEDFSFEADVPGVVEVLMHHQKENHRYIVNVINVQEHHPVIPVHDIVLRIRMNGRKCVKASILPEGKSLQFKQVGGFIQLKLQVLDVFSMLEILYR